MTAVLDLAERAPRSQDAAGENRHSGIDGGASTEPRSGPQGGPEAAPRTAGGFPALGGGGRGVGDSGRKCGDFVPGLDAWLSPYISASWWQPEGRRRVIRRLEKRGFPDLDGFLFATLTGDPEGLTEEEVFEKGNDRRRRVICELRKRGFEIKRYFSKLELHGSGYPHWHIGIDCRRYIPAELLQELWGLGFVKVKRVKANSWRYLMKYVVKGNGVVPDWVLDYPRRIRVFQTSVGFYAVPSEPRQGKEPSGKQKETRTLRQKFVEWEGRGVVRTMGAYYPSQVRLRDGFHRTFCDLASTPGHVVDFYNIGVRWEELLNYVTGQN